MDDPEREPPAARDATVAGLAEHFLRHEAGRLVARLTARHGADRLELIEDAVQAALLSAWVSWGTRGVPDKPAAWLTRVAHNRLIDQLRRRDRDAPASAAGFTAESPLPPPHSVFGAEIDDDELRMLFVCCDPTLPERTQLVLALKLLCGFGTREIATRLFTSEDNVLKTLSRGRARLREAWGTPQGGWDSLPPAALPERLPRVLSVIYLLFNEGYSSARQDAVIVRELCDEAVRLAQRLVAHPVGDDPQAWGLLALMHLHRARLAARVGTDGELLLLDEQDRTHWDRTEIQRGILALGRAGQSGRFSRYLGEAAILYEHCVAPSFGQTRWNEIVDLYELLETHCGPSPLYTLNRAIALAAWQGPAAGLALLEGMTPPTWLLRYYLWDATLGELLRRDGQPDRARPYLQRAVEQAPTGGERRVFERRLAACRHDPMT